MKYFVFIWSFVALLSCTKQAELSGELKQWHKVTLTFEGPECSETSVPNPFTDYRLDVTFTQGDQQFVVPGYFAADGEAAYTSAESGNKWRVHFSPNTTGEWHYEVSFLRGEGVALDATKGVKGASMHKQKGSFVIEASDKSGPDFRAKGRLEYVGEHYLQFAGTGEYFIKNGVDAPENILAYYEMDNTPNVGKRMKYLKDHAQDYNADADAYLWGPNKDKGKNMLGGLNYLSSKGLNAFSFLTFNVDGDDRNVFPYLLNTDLASYETAANTKKNRECWEQYVVHNRFDVSKMDQWEQVFSYAEMKGLFLHYKLQENENDQKMDGGDTGVERQLYLREIVARYAHHLGLNWNLGEENTMTVEQTKAMGQFITDTDPYDGLVVVHTFPNQTDKYYGPFANEATPITGFSIQTNKPDFNRVHGVVDQWVKASAAAGRKLVVAVDEPGDARHALVPDADNPEHNNARINAMWGAYLAGGAGLEWYFGYQHDHSDLTCQSWRSRDLFWDQCRVALDFFDKHKIPVTEMEGMDTMTASEEDFVFAKAGEVYLIYAKTGAPVHIDLPDVGYTAIWVNPRTGEETTLAGETEDESVKLACPSAEDWLLYLSK